MSEFDQKLVDMYSKGSPINNAKSHLKSLDLLDKEIAKNTALRAKLKAAEAEIVDYDKLTQLQHQAGVRATKLYNDKYGTNIGLVDAAQSEVFLMEENDGLKVKLEAVEKEIEQLESINSRTNIECRKAVKERDEARRQAEHLEFQIGEACLKIAEYEHQPLDEVKAWCDGLRNNYIKLQAQVAEIAGYFKMSEENLQNAQRREAEAIHDKIQLQAQVSMLRGALELLARLGHGETYGNSIGNVMAQDALRKYWSEAGE